MSGLIIFFGFLNRGGRGGGYKELDEEEIEETRRRRREAEEVRLTCTGNMFTCIVHSVLTCFLFYSG